MCEQAADRSQNDGKEHAQDGRHGYAFGHALLIAGTETLTEADSEAAGESVDEAEDEVYDDTGGADGGESLGSHCFTDNNGVCQRVKQLEQISENDRNGEFQKDGKRLSLCEIHIVLCGHSAALLSCFAWLPASCRGGRSG